MTKPPQRTPWGAADAIEEMAEGIWWLSTPSHGGFWLSPERRAAMPEELRQVETFAGGPWYEEDCDWAIVVSAFPDARRTDGQQEPAFDQEARRAAYDSLRRWKPAVFAAHYD